MHFRLEATRLWPGLQKWGGESCSKNYEWLWVHGAMHICVCAHMCVLSWRGWLRQSSSASLKSSKVGQPNLSQGGAVELLLCFLLTVEVITSLVMQMSIPLFKLSAMQGSCQCRHMKKKIKKEGKKTPSILPFFSTFPFFFPLSFLNQISGTWQHKHQTLMWKTTPLHQKTCQSQSPSPSLSVSFLKHPCSFPHSLVFSPSPHIPAHYNALPHPHFFPPLTWIHVFIG